MFTVKKQYSFDAAHFLAKYNGKCRNIHGHRWTISATITANELNSKGMVIDFTELKNALKTICEKFDHGLIVEKNSLKKETLAALLKEDFKIIEVEFTPTAENFAKHFYNELIKSNFKLEAVEVWESPGNSAKYQL